MSKLGKFKEIFAIGSAAAAKPFVPGAAGSVLDAVTKGIADKGDPKNEQVLKDMAAHNDEQDRAILALHERLKKAGFSNIPRATVTYCKYGDTRMKPTDIWTNNLKHWRPRPMCFNGNPNCRHEQCSSAESWAGKCGTLKLSGAYERSKVPAALAREVLKAAERRFASK